MADVTLDNVLLAVREEWPELLEGCRGDDPVTLAKYIARRIGFDYKHDTSASELLGAISKASVGEIKLHNATPDTTQATITTDPGNDTPQTADAGSW